MEDMVEKIDRLIMNFGPMEKKMEEVKASISIETEDYKQGNNVMESSANRPKIIIRESIV